MSETGAPAYPQPDMNAIVGTHDILMITLDTLRYDVAERLWREERTPHLRRWLAPDGWERRHTPGSFTFAAHQAFFAGFLPTPARPGPHPRLFAAAFQGSVTTTTRTCAFEEADIVSGLAARGYHTACIGGVGFFNKRTRLGEVLPSFFAESHWSPQLGVTHPRSTHHQVALAAELLARQPDDAPLFLFMNVSALHQPNNFYLPGATGDTLASHAAALEYVDTAIPALIDALHRRPRPTFAIVCGDHGTAYGEDGYSGHRLAHEVVYTVPYAHGVVPGAPC